MSWVGAWEWDRGNGIMQSIAIGVECNAFSHPHTHTHTHTHTHHAQVIEETLRMHCPVRGPFKEAPVGGVNLSGYSFPGGTMIFMSLKISMLVHVCMFVCMYV